MCRWRHVRNLYLRCGHAENLPYIEIKCGSTTCKFSPNHPADCVPPKCSRTCNQYRLFPEQHTHSMDGVCTACGNTMHPWMRLGQRQASAQRNPSSSSAGSPNDRQDTLEYVLDTMELHGESSATTPLTLDNNDTTRLPSARSATNKRIQLQNSVEIDEYPDDTQGTSQGATDVIDYAGTESPPRSQGSSADDLSDYKDSDNLTIPSPPTESKAQSLTDIEMTVEQTETKLPSQRGLLDLNRAERERPHQPRLVEGSGFGPPLYEAVTVATSVIYWPEHSESKTEGDNAKSASEPTTGLEEFSKCLPNGGTVLSIHRPTTALAWLEENYDFPVVKFIHKKFVGPLAMMLFPDTPALAIFGPHSSQKMARLAQRLANKSKFPVISRPSADNPMLQFASPSPAKDDQLRKIRWQPFDQLAVDHVLVGNTIPQESGDSGNSSTAQNLERVDRNGAPSDNGELPTLVPSNGGNGENPNDNDNTYQAAIESKPTSITSNTPTLYTANRDGGEDPEGNDPNSEADQWDDWISPFHLTKSEITIQGSMQTVLSIQSRTQFKTYAVGDAPNDLDTPGSVPGLRPQAQARTTFVIEFNPKTVSIERSHAVLGLLAHRPASIISNTNLDCGFEEPTQTFKHGTGDINQNTFSVTAGVAGAVPAPTVTGRYAHGRSATRALEATDSKPMPPCQIQVEPGERFRKRHGKDYMSYNYTYCPRAPSLPGLSTNRRYFLNVGFGLGINFNPYKDKDSECLIQPPQVSFINRNQVFVWVQHDRLGAEGTTIFLTNEIPDIRRRSQIIKDNEAQIDFQTGQIVNSDIHRGNERDGGFSLATLTLPDRPKYSVQSPSAVKKLQARTRKALEKVKSAPRPQVTLTPNEAVSRGWDATNNRWREPIYPQLDMHLESVVDTAAAIVDPTVVAYTISPFEKESRPKL
ncbi:hypothetical protein B0H16DRAFT_1602515 [Mycena metata]|uniref:Uncharacterized protein n=1 Tax=Mycena metata TaxID=1033252 RepID=A0AAD7MKX5_9AGAR|nr:hypothetical protein B0H16DRAFT_1602515 [Mycena metata]